MLTGKSVNPGASRNADTRVVRCRDTSSLPPYPNITNNAGMIVLGYKDACDPAGGEHLDLGKWASCMGSCIVHPNDAI
jgi:hypothetical protein